MKLLQISVIASMTFLFMLGCDRKAPEKHVQPDDDPHVVNSPVGTKANQPAPSSDYKYEPAVSILEGRLHQATFFGAPGYGAEPETDLQEMGFVLKLNEPIAIKSDPASLAKDAHNESLDDVTEIQLIPHQANLLKYKGLKMRVTGTLFRARTDHHHMSVVMDVQRIQEL